MMSLGLFSALSGGLSTILPMMLMGGTSVAGGLLGAAMSDAQASKTRKWQAEQNRIQRDWLTDMSNTAHQREVDDLRAAGLNPLLSAKGSGASVPSYSGQSASTVDTGAHVARGIEGGIANALGTINAINTAKLTRAQATLADAQATKALRDAETQDRVRWSEYYRSEAEFNRSQRELENLEERRKEFKQTHRLAEYDRDLARRRANLEDKKFALEKERLALQRNQQRIDAISKGIDMVAGGLFRQGGKNLGNKLFRKRR